MKIWKVQLSSRSSNIQFCCLTETQLKYPASTFPWILDIQPQRPYNGPNLAGRNQIILRWLKENWSERLGATAFKIRWELLKTELSPANALKQDFIQWDNWNQCFACLYITALVLCCYVFHNGRNLIDSVTDFVKPADKFTETNQELMVPFCDFDFGCCWDYVAKEFSEVSSEDLVVGISEFCQKRSNWTPTYFLFSMSCKTFKANQISKWKTCFWMKCF